MSEPVIAMTTTNTEKEAKALASLFVEKRVAACVQIIPKIHSIYEWDGEIHDDQEYLLMIKTLNKNVEKLQKLLSKHHSYEVPEFLVLPVIGSTDEYEEWMNKVTK